MSVGACQRHIEDKARLVLDGYLRTALAAESIPGVSERVANLTINVGLDPTSIIRDGVATDTLPQVDFYAIAADSDYDAALSARDIEWTYQVGATVQFDGSDFAAAARSAQWLAGHASDVIEKRLCDPTTQSMPNIWLVKTSTPVSTEAAPLDPGDSRLSTMRATADITIRTRTEYELTPTYSVQELTPGDTTHIDLSDATVKLDAATLTTATPLRETTVTTTTAALAGATAIVLDMAGVCTWSDPASYTVAMVRHQAAATGTFTALDETITVPLATYDINNGDRWLVTVIGPKLRPITWALEWSVTA